MLSLQGIRKHARDFGIDDLVMNSRPADVARVIEILLDEIEELENPGLRERRVKEAAEKIRKAELIRSRLEDEPIVAPEVPHGKLGTNGFRPRGVFIEGL